MLPRRGYNPCYIFQTIVLNLSFVTLRFQCIARLGTLKYFGFIIYQFFSKPNVLLSIFFFFIEFSNKIVAGEVESEKKKNVSHTANNF